MFTAASIYSLLLQIHVSADVNDTMGFLRTLSVSFYVTLFLAIVLHGFPLVCFIQKFCMIMGEIDSIPPTLSSSLL